MSATKKSTCCTPAPKLIFACSGAADVGAIADKAARKLNAEDAGKMFCLAGIGGRISGILKSTEAATGILAIDGCALDCAKNCLLQAGITELQHLRLTDLGMEKGQSPVSDERVALAVVKGKSILSQCAEEECGCGE